MAKALRLTAEQRDNLVAYLDGELEEAETQYIDQVLAKSEVARHEVEALARTWELLDLLPKPNATEGFTDRTITTLKVSEMAVPLTEQAWFAYVRKGAIAAVWVAVLSLCGAGGYLLATRAVPNPQAQLMTDLPLIRNLDVYLEIEDLDFVRELQRSNLFARTTAPDADAVAADAVERSLAKSPTATDRAGLAKRYEQIAAMPQADRDRVQRNWELFRQMTPERQAYFRDLHQQLTEQPESLRTMLQTYAAWLPTLSPGDRDDLRQAGSAAQRLALVRELKDEQDANRESQVFDLNLDLQRWKQLVPPPPYLSQAELAAMMNLVEKRLPPSERTRLDQETKLPLERFVKIVQAAFNPLTGPRIVDGQLGGQLVELVEDEAIRSQLEATPDDQLRGELSRLIIRSLFKLIAERQTEFLPSESQLEQVFVALPGNDRYELMQLPPHELTRKLLMKYWEQQSGDEIKRLVQTRDELGRFYWFSRGPRPGFRGDRKDDRGREGPGRFERSRSPEGASPESQPDGQPPPR